MPAVSTPLLTRRRLIAAATLTAFAALAGGALYLKPLGAETHGAKQAAPAPSLRL